MIATGAWEGNVDSIKLIAAPCFQLTRDASEWNAQYDELMRMRYSTMRRDEWRLAPRPMQSPQSMGISVDAWAAHANRIAHAPEPATCAQPGAALSRAATEPERYTDAASSSDVERSDHSGSVGVR